MKLVELPLVPLVAPGLFRSSEAIRKMIGRGELVKGVHWFQKRRRGRIRIDIDAVSEMFSRPPEPVPNDAIPLARGGYLS